MVARICSSDNGAWTDASRSRWFVGLAHFLDHDSEITLQLKISMKSSLTLTLHKSVAGIKVGFTASSTPSSKLKAGVEPHQSQLEREKRKAELRKEISGAEDERSVWPTERPTDGEWPRRRIVA